MRELYSFIVARNIPLFLNEEEMEHPISVLQEFASSFDLDDLRQALSQFYTQTMLTSDDDLGDTDKRSNLHSTFIELRKAVEAAHLVGQKFNLKPEPHAD